MIYLRRSCCFIFGIIQILIWKIQYYLPPVMLRSVLLTIFWSSKSSKERIFIGKQHIFLCRDGYKLQKGPLFNSRVLLIKPFKLQPIYFTVYDIISLIYRPFFSATMVLIIDFLSEIPKAFVLLTNHLFCWPLWFSWLNVSFSSLFLSHGFCCQFHFWQPSVRVEKFVAK